jgi:DNA anti-recombination protein RmuC
MIDNKDKEIQRLQNQVNALGHSLIRALTLIQDVSNGVKPENRIDAEIRAIKSLLKSPQNGGLNTEVIFLSSKRET